MKVLYIFIILIKILLLIFSISDVLKNRFLNWRIITFSIIVLLLELITIILLFNNSKNYEGIIMIFMVLSTFFIFGTLAHYDLNSYKIISHLAIYYCIAECVIITILYYQQIKITKNEYNGFKYKETIYINQINKPREYYAYNAIPTALKAPLELLDNYKPAGYDEIGVSDFYFETELTDTSRTNLFNRIDEYNNTIGKKIDSLTDEIINEYKNEFPNENRMYYLYETVISLDAYRIMKVKDVKH